MERVVVKTRVKQGYINIFYEHLNDKQILRFNHEIPRKHWTFYIKLEKLDLFKWESICSFHINFNILWQISIFCDKSVNILPKIDLKILNEMNKLQNFNNLQPRLNVKYLCGKKSDKIKT